MKTFKNIANEAKTIANIWTFAAGEQRKVDDQTAGILELSPHFVEVKDDTEVQDKTKWGKGKKSENLDD